MFILSIKLMNIIIIMLSAKKQYYLCFSSSFFFTLLLANLPSFLLQSVLAWTKMKTGLAFYIFFIILYIYMYTFMCYLVTFTLSWFWNKIFSLWIYNQWKQTKKTITKKKKKQYLQKLNYAEEERAKLCSLRCANVQCECCKQKTMQIHFCYSERKLIQFLLCRSGNSSLPLCQGW